MASRLSSGVYAAPGTYASTQANINLDNQISNPRLAYLNSGGLGTSNTASSQILPILPQNATPSTSGLTSATTTGTVTLGSPHGLTIGSSGQTFTITGAGVSGYNITAGTIGSVTGPYTFTYTLSGGASGLAASGGGTVSLLGGTVAALNSYQPVLNGTSINGSTCGPLELWGDGAIWDTTNSRYITPQLGGYDPANIRS
jgi:hypothetical protein